MNRIKAVLLSKIENNLHLNALGHIAIKFTQFLTTIQVP